MGGSVWSKPLLIGLALSRPDGEPLSGSRIGGRLAFLCGVSLDTYLGMFDRCNVADTPDIVETVSPHGASQSC